MSAGVDPQRPPTRYARIGADRATVVAERWKRAADLLLVATALMLLVAGVLSITALGWAATATLVAAVACYRERHSLTSWADGYLLGLRHGRENDPPAVRP